MRQAAVAAGVVWAAPVLTSSATPAAAAGSPPPAEGTTTTSTTSTLPDGGPRPETPDDCKKGGWQRYGIFRNQGDCVSWVATHGKNEPGKNQPGH